MGNLKMIDMFKGEVLMCGHQGMVNVLLADGKCLAVFSKVAHGEAAAHAINNHDRLIAENTRLREMLKGDAALFGFLDSFCETHPSFELGTRSGVIMELINEIG
ncbi:MAG: hypothetical protein GY776_01730 [Alteromonas sp.]|nr:hypothetical protein [Alteromonas sp.]